MDGIYVSWGSFFPKDARACRHTGDGSHFYAILHILLSNRERKSSMMEQIPGICWPMASSLNRERNPH